MSDKMKKWLSENPPKAELTELEKSFDFDIENAKKYRVYFEEADGSRMYRVREYLPNERKGLSFTERYELDSFYRALCETYALYGFNVIGYLFTDLKRARLELDLFTLIH